MRFFLSFLFNLFLYLISQKEEYCLLSAVAKGYVLTDHVCDVWYKQKNTTAFDMSSSGNTMASKRERKENQNRGKTYVIDLDFILVSTLI